MKIIRFFILLAIVFLIVWAYLQKNPNTWNESPIPPSLKSSFDQLRIWSQENAPQLREELDQLLQDMTQRAEDNPELLQTAMETVASDTITEVTDSLVQPTASPLEDLPSLDEIRTVVQKLKDSKDFDLATRWENIAKNFTKMAGIKQKEVTEVN